MYYYVAVFLIAFVAMPKSDEDLIQWVFNDKLPMDEMIPCMNEKMWVPRSALYVLKGSNWLDDQVNAKFHVMVYVILFARMIGRNDVALQVINTFLKIVANHENQRHMSRRSVFIMDTHVYSDTLSYDINTVAKRLRGKNVTSYTLIFVPIHCRGNHWTVVV